MAERDAIAVLLAIGELADQEYVLLSRTEILENVSSAVAEEIDFDVVMQELHDRGYINIRHRGGDDYFLNLTVEGKAKVAGLRKVIAEREEELRLEAEAREKKRFALKRGPHVALADVVDGESVMPDSFDCDVVEEDRDKPLLDGKKTKMYLLISTLSGFVGGVLGGVLTYVITLFV